MLTNPIPFMRASLPSRSNPWPLSRTDRPIPLDEPLSVTVTSVTWSGGTYVPLANHDPDNDSDGTTIAIAKPA